MDAPLRLGLRDPLHAVGAPLVLEYRIGPLPLDREGDLLEAADLRGGLGQDLDRVAAPLRVPGEHLEEVAREERRLVAACARPDLHDHVLVVVGIALDRRQADLLRQLLQPGRRLREHRLELGRCEAHAGGTMGCDRRLRRRRGVSHIRRVGPCHGHRDPRRWRFST